MDDHRETVAMSDAALEREIQAALAVDPSPEFLARVRARIATEVVSAPWHIRWDFITAGVALASLLAATFFWADQERLGGEAEQDSPAAILRSEAPLVAIPPATVEPPAASPATAVPTRTVAESAITDGTRASARDSIPVPEVVIAPEETAGLRSFMALVSDGRFDSSMLGEQDAAASDQADGIVIEPIAIEPLAALALLEGERQ
jgi:hypothetical protein